MRTNLASLASLAFAALLSPAGSAASAASPCALSLPAPRAEAASDPASRLASGPAGRLRVRVSWGHEARDAAPHAIAIVLRAIDPAATPFELEEGEGFRDGAWRTRAGGGDVDGVELELELELDEILEPPKPTKPPEPPEIPEPPDLPGRPDAPVPPLQSIWSYLLEHSDAETVRRLRQDPFFHPDPRRLTVRANDEGTRGFTVTLTQLLEARTLWVPSLDILVAAGDPPATFEEHRARLAAAGDRRILQRVREGPEASFEESAASWEDLGSPSYRNSHQVGPGHIVCLAWDGSMAKFGVDRWAGVWNDYGNPDRFRLSIDAGGISGDVSGDTSGDTSGGVSGDLSADRSGARDGAGDRGRDRGADRRRDAAASWKGQTLADGLPVLTTVLDRDGVRCEVEQLAHPLHGPPEGRRGDIPMVLLARVRLLEREGRARTARIALAHEREISEGSRIVRRAAGGAEVWEESPSGRTLLALRGEGAVVESSAATAATAAGASAAGAPGEGASPAAASNRAGTPRPARVSIVASVALEAGGSRDILVALPSPPVAPAEREALLCLDHDAARESTLRFWSGWLERGALFSVPEERVNRLFRANLWHALRLPRRHGVGGTGRSVGAGGSVGAAGGLGAGGGGALRGGRDGPGPRIDLPYSNFAYDQTGTPWPVNHAVYVDAMIHDLRGHHDVSAEELAAIYRNNQKSDGRVDGYASWGVYTPGMVYAAARHFLLSGDRGSFERLLPPTLKALDWCLAELRRASGREGPGSGLVLAPLNDLSHDERAWAFNQAYLHGGIDLLGRALEEIGHPRAAECREAAARLREAIEREFGRASTEAPLVELRDGTWSPYVPADALSPRRLLEVWYPTDVDTGALHLPRLGALDPEGHLTTCLLEDHEDNLYLGGLGMANEPVYNQQATAYLLRDEPLPAIRAFYGMMACAFSHGALEPVEHRWGWGQYFGPPSTDGAWFDLYRHMLIRERDDGSLLLLGAAPRRWLEDGKRIRIERAPTRYGPISVEVESRVGAGEDLDGRAGSGEILATVGTAGSAWRRRPGALIVRFRHPLGFPLRSAAVDGEDWTDFDPAREWVRIPGPSSREYTIVARYGGE